MPDVAVTIRHARTAVHLLLSGALRDIEAEFLPEERDAQLEATSNLFNNVVDEISMWEIPGTFDADVGAAAELVDSLQAMLGEPNCPDLVRVLLTNHRLLP